MQVKLISVTQPLIKTQDETRYLSPEELIVYCARVSNPANQLNTETAPKLLSYCIKNKHWSVFEQVDLGFEIKTSRAIATQILRHKSASFQEFSQRYALVTEFEPIELRKQAEKNRQSSTEIVNPTLFNEEKAIDYINQYLKMGQTLYSELIERGISKESARFILPLTTSTTLYMKNNVRNWIHYLELRCSEHTQKEHRMIAKEIKEVFILTFPNIAQALDWGV